MNHVAFFGDGAKTFALTAPMIAELQHKTGSGIGAVFQRVQNQQYRLDDLLETIRCGLIGGGTSPLEADRLVRTYGATLPIADTLTLALAILAVRFFGNDEAGTDE